MEVSSGMRSFSGMKYAEGRMISLGKASWEYNAYTGGILGSIRY